MCMGEIMLSINGLQTASEGRVELVSRRLRVTKVGEAGVS